MRVQLFDIEKIQQKETGTGYYMLQNVGKHADDVTLSVNTVDGEVPFENFSAFRMNDGKVLIAIHSINRVFADYSITATDETGAEEVINTQTYERLHQYYSLSAAEDLGFFIFENSVPVPPDGYGWRCDSNRFGPQFFMKNDVDYDPLFADLSEIIVYEPVLSVSGTAHIIYVNGTRDAEVKNFHLEEYVLPRATRTLSEMFKLITEWAEVSLPPWDNSETISLRARQFLEKMQFSPAFLADAATNQLDMQVFRYLKGDQNARLKVPSPAPLSTVADVELKKKVSHLSLPHLLSIFSGSVDDIEPVFDQELAFVTSRQNALIDELGLSMDSFNTSNANDVIQAMKDARDGAVNASFVVYVTTLAVRREILDNAGI